jgi:hypothetical protein
LDREFLTGDGRITGAIIAAQWIDDSPVDYGNPMANGFQPGTGPWHNGEQPGNWRESNAIDGAEPNNDGGIGRQHCVVKLDMDGSSADWADFNCDAWVTGFVCKKVLLNHHIEKLYFFIKGIPSFIARLFCPTTVQCQPIMHNKNSRQQMSTFPLYQSFHSFGNIMPFT